MAKKKAAETHQLENSMSDTKRQKQAIQKAVDAEFLPAISLLDPSSPAFVNHAIAYALAMRWLHKDDARGARSSQGSREARG